MKVVLTIEVDLAGGEGKRALNVSVVDEATDARAEDVEALAMAAAGGVMQVLPTLTGYAVGKIQAQSVLTN